MNLNDAWTQAGMSGGIVIISGILYKIYTVINHKRVRCNLCGKELEASIDFEETTPPKEKVKVDNFEKNNPIHLVVPK